MLVQSKRNKHAALKLMRKLLKKYAFVPERLVTDDLRSYSAAVRELGPPPADDARRTRRGGEPAALDPRQVLVANSIAFHRPATTSNLASESKRKGYKPCREE